MRNARGVLEVAGGLLFAAYLLWFFLFGFRPMIPVQQSAQIQATASEEFDYPAPYPPPVLVTSTIIESPTEIFLEFPATRTPIPITPAPTLIGNPGPEPTSIPLISPAIDSSGEILFLVKESEEGEPKVYKVGVGAFGEKVSSSVKVSDEEMIEDSFVSRSPDGKYIAINGPWGAFRIFDTTKNKTVETYPIIGSYDIFYNWFPDSQSVLHGRDALVLSNIFTGEDTVFVVPGYGGIQGAAASPDGKHIVYSYTSDSTFAQGLWIINSDGQNAHLLFEGTSPSNMSWSPDGKRIALNGGMEVINGDGTNLRNFSPDIILPQCYFLPALWSPDSRRMAVVTSERGDSFCPGWTEDNFRGTNIVIIDVDQKTITPLPVKNGTGNIDPIWSPDGQHLAFISNRSGTSEIWVINMDGTNLRQLTANGQSVRFPQWVRPVGR